MFYVEIWCRLGKAMDCFFLLEPKCPAFHLRLFVGVGRISLFESANVFLFNKSLIRPRNWAYARQPKELTLTNRIPVQQHCAYHRV
jgi:hypothetical protein